MNNDIQIWNGPDGIAIPSNTREPQDIVKYANRSEERRVGKEC